MNAWLRVSALVKILFFEFIAVFCLAMELAGALRARGVLGCPPDNRLSTPDAVFFTIGLLCAAWLVWRILRPTVVELDYRPNLKVGPLIMPNPAIPSVDFEFLSTHPSYVLVELVVLAAISVLLLVGDPPAVGGCSDVGPYLMARIGVVLAVFFPAFRLFAWYILGRRSRRPMPGVWKPVLIFWCIISPLVLLAVWILIGQKLKESRLPLVDGAAFAGGLGAHGNLENQLVRVRGTLKLPRAARCACDDPKDPNFCKVAALLIDVGGGELVVHTSGIDSKDLFKKGDRPAGSPFSATGRLMKMPDAKKEPYNRLDCGWDEFGPPPAEGRAFVEVEYP